MSDAISGLKPEAVWRYFAEISAIPRGSKNEKAISDYVMRKAKELGLAAQQDKYRNVIVRKPASAGKEKVPMICLQGHLDMVCEKNKDTVHDFEKDPIALVRKGNLLMADGTTLGADNGIAVATNLAIMADKSLVHGPLEFLFTVDEETGLTGANHLAPALVQSRILMNLDSEEEGALYVGCSGGKNTLGVWKVKRGKAPATAAAMLLQVKGLKGGHSGLEIDKGRGNSIKILNRALGALLELGADVSTLEGGNKSNAIPREAEALVFVPKDKVKKAQSAVGGLNNVVRAELATVEPDLQLVFEASKSPKNASVIAKKDMALITKALAAMSHGVMKMSADIAGLVETSTNLAIVRTERSAVTVTTSQRSSVATEIDDLLDSVAAVFTLAGAKVQQTEGYPGWKPNLDSRILKVCKTTYKNLYAKDPEVKAIHAGLECGIIGEKYPGIDMVSFGPTLEGVHSPDEKIHIDTVDKFWKFTLAVLRNVA